MRISSYFKSYGGEGEYQVWSGALIDVEPGVSGNSNRGDITPRLYEPSKIMSGVKIRPNAIVYTGSLLGPDVYIADGAIVREGCFIARGTIIGAGAIVENNVFIGGRTKIMTKAYLCAGTTIGSDCFVGPGAVFLNDKYLGHPSVPDEVRRKERDAPHLERGVHIGGNATILPGVCLATGVIIGAGGVVTKDITEPGVYYNRGVPVVYNGATFGA